MNPKKNKLIAYGVTTAIALLMAFSVARLRGLAAGQPFGLMCRYLSDGFFVPGMLLTGFGALVWIAGTGFFDIFSYGFKSLLVLFTSLRKPQEHVKFYEYKLEKDAKRGKPMHFLLVVGVVCLLLAVALVMLYYRLTV